MWVPRWEEQQRESRHPVFLSSSKLSEISLHPVSVLYSLLRGGANTRIVLSQSGRQGCGGSLKTE
jgi:hypothetical protein